MSQFIISKALLQVRPDMVMSQYDALLRHLKKHENNEDRHSRAPGLKQGTSVPKRSLYKTYSNKNTTCWVGLNLNSS